MTVCALAQNRHPVPAPTPAPPTKGIMEQVLQQQRNSALDAMAQCIVNGAELQEKMTKLEAEIEQLKNKEELGRQLGDPRNKEEK